MKEKREHTEITVKILKDIAEHLKEMAELTYSTEGHMIDKMALNWVAEEPTVAAHLILEDILTHTANLYWDGRN
jgi:hypothetical protein